MSQTGVAQVMWLRRVAPILVALVGLVFLASGGGLLVSQGWSHATGTVGECSTRLDRTGSSSRTVQTCVVTWDAGGRGHSADIAVATPVRRPGDKIDLRVDGDRAAEASPTWAGAASTGVGVILLAVAGVLLMRSRR